LQRVGEAPLALQRQREVIAGLGMVGAQPHRRLECSERAVEIARPPPRRSEVILRVEEVRLELNRALECGQRVGRAAEAPRADRSCAQPRVPADTALLRKGALACGGP
jgi:hypothetical protein